MAKSRSKDEVEELRGKVRELQKQNRELKKVLGRLKKNSHRVEELEDLFQDLTDDDYIPPQPKVNKCSCGGAIEKIELGIRTMFKCNSCGKRETKK